MREISGAVAAALTSIVNWHPFEMRRFFAPSHSRCIRLKINASDVVMDADFPTTHAGEEGLGLIGVGSISGAVFDLMVDALYGEVGRELVPMRGFVGVND